MPAYKQALYLQLSSANCERKLPTLLALALEQLRRGFGRLLRQRSQAHPTLTATTEGKVKKVSNREPFASGSPAASATLFEKCRNHTVPNNKSKLLLPSTPKLAEGIGQKLGPAVLPILLAPDQAAIAGSVPRLLRRPVAATCFTWPMGMLMHQEALNTCGSKADSERLAELKTPTLALGRARHARREPGLSTAALTKPLPSRSKVRRISMPAKRSCSERATNTSCLHYITTMKACRLLFPV